MIVGLLAWMGRDGENDNGKMGDGGSCRPLRRRINKEEANRAQIVTLNVGISNRYFVTTQGRIFILPPKGVKKKCADRTYLLLT